jgi:hypothetical protein
VSESADDQEHDHDHEHGHEGEGEGDEGTQEVLDEMLETIRQAKVEPLVLSTVSTFASVAYGKLETKDLAEAKRAIDVIDALLPLIDDEGSADIKRDFGQALTNLKLAYADAVGSAG